ncbi:MAG TPA: 5'/3'-nucleotidase SurE [Phycisphaerae bacterium]|nr:5'/3'-nucleotidase SurE [Phycisphaerae bacterium]
MRFLLTNDDGPDVAGLAALQRAVADLGESTVVVPRDGTASRGHAVTRDAVLSIERTADRQYVVDGLPADCVRLALTVLRDQIGPIDWVLAGINHGANLGVDVYYSGTVGAAREAAILGLSAIALSQYYRRGVEPDWARTERWAGSIVRQMVDRSDAQAALWNVNFPALPADQKLTGVAVCPVSTDPVPVVYENVQPVGQGRLAVRYTGVYADRAARTDTDVQRLFAGWITVTPLRLDATADASEPAFRNPE